MANKTTHVSVFDEVRALRLEVSPMCPPLPAVANHFAVGGHLSPYRLAGVYIPPTRIVQSVLCDVDFTQHSLQICLSPRRGQTISMLHI